VTSPLLLSRANTSAAGVGGFALGIGTLSPPPPPLDATGADVDSLAAAAVVGTKRLLDRGAFSPAVVIVPTDVSLASAAAFRAALAARAAARASGLADRRDDRTTVASLVPLAAVGVGVDVASALLLERTTRREDRTTGVDASVLPARRRRDTKGVADEDAADAPVTAESGTVDAGDLRLRPRVIASGCATSEPAAAVVDDDDNEDDDDGGGASSRNNDDPRPRSFKRLLPPGPRARHTLGVLERLRPS